MLLDVSILSPQRIIFKGTARSVIVPGEQGIFEVLPFHKRILSRLISGILYVDEKRLQIQRGIIKVNQNKVIVIAEEVVE